MRLSPLVACLSLATLLSCQAAPVAAPVPSPTAPVVVTPTVTPDPAATPQPSPSVEPSPSPSLAASPSPAPSASPSGSPGPLGEANHGDKAFPTAPGGNPLDLRTATASATAGSASAIGAIDGRPYTQWAARANVSDPVALVIDLGSARAFKQVDVLPDASPEVTCFFNVDVSTNGTTWRTVGTGQGRGSNEDPTWGTATFPVETARYVRVKPTSWGTSWVAVWEIQLRN